MSIHDIDVGKRKALLVSAHTHGVDKIRVFGSMARGDARADSDIDFLVSLQPGYNLIDLGAFLMDAQDILGRKVDVVTEQAIHPRIKEQILREAIAL